MEQGKLTVMRDEDGWILINRLFVFGILGFSFCFAGMLAPILSSDLFHDESTKTMFVGIFVLSALVCFIAIWLLSQAMQEQRAIMAALSMAISLAAVVFAVLGSFWREEGLIPCLVLSGISFALISSLWFEFVCIRMKGYLRTSIAMSVVLSTVWVLLQTLFFPSRSLIVAGAFLCLSSCIYALLRNRFAGMNEFPSISSGESDGRSRISWRSIVLAMVATFVFGFAARLLQNYLLPSAVLVGASLLFVSALVLVDVSRAGGGL